MRISRVWNSDIPVGMQLVLKTPDDITSTSPSETRPESKWDLRAVSLQEWIALWAPVQTLILLHAWRKDGTNAFRSRVDGEIAGARFATGCELFQHAQPHIERSGGMISVQRLHSGFAAVEYPDCNYVHRPEMITINDYNQSFRGSHHNAEIEQVLIPRSALGLSDADPISPVLLDLESRSGRQLAVQLEQFFASDPGRAFDPELLKELVASEIRESWRPASDREEWWIGRRNLIRKYIDTHLEDPNLGPHQICELFNMSRATLYRMFEPDGGVRRRIQDRRLFSAIWDLAISGIRRGRLSQVAERWGFSSDANFNRAVKLAFGRPPGTLFKTGYRGNLDRGGQMHVEDALLDWLSEQESETFSAFIRSA